MINCLCTGGQCSDKHYTRMNHVDGNDRTLKNVIDHELMQSSWWQLGGPEMDAITQVILYRISKVIQDCIPQ